MKFVLPILFAAWSLLSPASAGPLSDAAKKGDATEVELLLASGADANEEDPVASPLHWAAMNGHIGVVRLLVANGANLNDNSSMLGTPLHAAVRFGRVEVAETLIDAGADPDARNSDDFTPLLVAVSEDRLPTVEVLIAGGADVNAVTDMRRGRGRGPTIPLHVAIDLGEREIAEALLAAGARPMPPAVPTQLLGLGDAERGRELVYQDCSGCHTISSDDPTQTKTDNFGPPLMGVIGRPVASHPGFEYSDALIDFGGTWTPERLYQFALLPTLTVPGTSMRWSHDRTPEMVSDMMAYFASVVE